MSYLGTHCNLFLDCIVVDMCTVADPGPTKACRERGSGEPRTQDSP